MATPFGRYVLEERLARGGMGEVFRAVAVGADGFEKPVVVKRVLPQLAGRERLVEMFTAEAKLMTRLAHPNVVQVLDFGKGDGDDYFLVMELVDGVDLGRFVRRHRDRDEPIPIPLALFIASQMLRGLAYAHARSFDDGRTLVHRDVTPGNVLLSRVGEVKLADFGVALVTEAEDDEASGTLRVGKPRYMSPEQFEGRPVDARADLFSVGVVLFQLLTGELPFNGATVDEYREAVAEGRVRRVTDLREGLPTAADAIFERACAPAAADRFEGAPEMARAVAALKEEGVTFADADDLAAAVERVLAELGSEAPRVIRLAPDAAAPEGSIAGELTRVGTDADGQFTVRLTGTEDGAAEDREAPTPPIAKRRPRAPWVFVGVGVAAAALIGALLPWTSDAPGSTEPAPSAAPKPSSSGPVTVALPGTGASSASAAPSATASAPAPPRPARSVAPGAPATASPAPPEPAAPSATCRGNVHLFSRGSWSVSGGPTPVQAPGRYTWPCGTFVLTAVSRIDPAQRRSSTVRVREGRTAVFDLR